MKYPKNPYYLNSTYKNKIAKGESFVAQYSASDVDNESTVQLLYTLGDLIETEDVRSVFQVGYGFGDILLSLSNLYDLKLSGIEFNPIFPAYANNFFNLYGNKSIRLEIGVDLDSWQPFANECDLVFATDWMKGLAEDHFKEIFQRMVDMSSKYVVLPEIGYDIDYLNASEDDNGWIVVDTTELETKRAEKPTPEEVILYGQTIINTPDIDKEKNDEDE